MPPIGQPPGEEGSGAGVGGAAGFSTGDAAVAMAERPLRWISAVLEGSSAEDDRRLGPRGARESVKGSDG
jgi:hypothetical protein